MPPQLANRATTAPVGSEGVGEAVLVAATGTTAAGRQYESADPPADAAGPGALHDSSRSCPGTTPRGIDPQDGDPNNNAATDELPAEAAAVVAPTAREDCESRSSQSSEAPANVPGQDTVPAGLLWSDFGGGREAGEDAEETASREFAEESFGMFHGVRLESDSVARSQVRPCNRWILFLVVSVPPSRWLFDSTGRKQAFGRRGFPFIALHLRGHDSALPLYRTALRPVVVRKLAVYLAREAPLCRRNETHTFQRRAPLSNRVCVVQATMSSALRDPSMRGKRVFESRNGGYVMFIAEVDFVPDLMMNLARKEILDGGSSESDAGDSGSRTHQQGTKKRHEGRL